MVWNYSFPYNKSLTQLYSKQIPLLLAINRSESPIQVLVDKHVRCIQWLGDNLAEGRDFEFSEQRGSSMVTVEYIYFDKEEDLLAFRLACGL